MVCIYCSTQTRVANSRPQKRLNQVWRRRACDSCGALFTTNESVDFQTSLVVRSQGGSLEPFSRDQLFVSILHAVGHRTEPIADAAALTATITGKLLRAIKTAEMSPELINSTALQTLKHFDSAAAVQYAAYHAIVKH